MRKIDYYYSAASHTEAPKLIHLLRGDLNWIVMKALEKDRTRSYETANGLAMDLQRYLTNEPVVARPPSAAYRFQKMVRRNKLAFTAGSPSVALGRDTRMLREILDKWRQNCAVPSARLLRARRV